MTVDPDKESVQLDFIIGHCIVFMRGKICQKGSSLTFFFVYEGRGDPNANISGPSSAHQLMPFKAFCHRGDNGPTLNSGLVAL